MTDDITVGIQVLDEGAASTAKHRSEYRVWGPAIDLLREGKTLFFPESELREHDSKYLQLIFSRKFNEWGRRFHTRKTEIDGVRGRIFWTLPDEAKD